MARKRSIKPEFFEDEEISSLSAWARLLYIGLWCHMDAEGVFEANVKLIRAKIFPLESLTDDDVLGLLGELSKPKNGKFLLIRILHNGKDYVYCPNFTKHQKIHIDEPIKFIKDKQILEDAKEHPTRWVLDTPCAPTLFPFPSPSPSALASTSALTSTSVKKNKKQKEPRQANPSDSTPVTLVKEAFFENYQKEFKREYTGWGPKEYRQATNWLKSVSLETAKRLCALYPKWNDPWVTKQGHPFGILIAQYVQLDAWAQNSKQLIAKIAAGKAAENVDLKRAVDFEEMKRGLKHTTAKQQALENLSSTGRVQKPIPITATQRILGESRDPFGTEVFDAPSESAFGESL